MCNPDRSVSTYNTNRANTGEGIANGPRERSPRSQGVVLIVRRIYRHVLVIGQTTAR